MRPVEVSTIVDAPRERVFDYLCDISNHAQFSDHLMEDFRLERIDSTGLGASARYRIGFPLGGIWGDCEITELERPYLVRLTGRMGRIGRIPTEAVYTLTSAGQNMTRVEYSFTAADTTPADRLRAALGLRAWLASRSARAVRRLAEVLESGEPSKPPVGVAAG
jgi:uncharacterized protein YndB with AHSA1/START domain